jgi:hypothetical protein
MRDIGLTFRQICNAHGVVVSHAARTARDLIHTRPGTFVTAITAIGAALN